MTAVRQPNRRLSAWLDATGLTRLEQVDLIAQSAQDAGCGIRVSLRSLIRWVNQGTVPHARTQELIAAALSAHLEESVSPHDLGWVDPAPGSRDTDQKPAPTGAAERAAEARVLRRQMLSLLAAGGTGLTASHTAILGQIRTLVEGTLQDGAPPANLASLEARAARYGQGYHGQAPTRLLRQVLREMLSVRGLLDRPQTAAARGRLLTVAARLAGVTGIILHDLGEHAEAVGWFTTAAEITRENRDNALESWVLSRHAMVEINFGSPHRALALGNQARATAGRAPSASAALAAAVQARALALLGQAESAQRALGAAEDLLGALHGEQVVDTWYGYPPVKHHIHASHALTLAGASGPAAAAQDQALALSRPTSWMTRTLLELDRAACLVHNGEAEAGAAHAVTALSVLPPAARCGVVLARARAVRGMLPPPAAALPATSSLHEIAP
jgi:hypothetical protein